MIIRISTLIILLLASGCKAGSEKMIELVVYAGSISKPFLEEAAKTFAAQSSNLTISIEFGGSGSILSRAKISRRGDIYVSGSPDFMEIALAKDLVHQNTIVELACLRPAIVYRKDTVKNISSLKDAFSNGFSVGIADPDTVCLGRVALRVMAEEKIKDGINKAKVVSHSCMALLSSLVEGGADVIVGWNVFTRMFPETLSAVPVLKDRYYPIMAAVLKSTEHPFMAKKFIEFLTSDKSEEIIRSKGYKPCREEKH